MSIEGKKLYFVLTMLSYFITIIIGISYIYTNELKLLLFTLLSLLISSVLYTFTNIKYYIIHLIFYLTIFVFLVSRPTIDYFKDGVLNTYQAEAYKFSFLIIAISVIGLFLGGILVSKKGENKERIANQVYIKNIRLVSLVVFLISYPFYTLRLVERLIFRLHTTYYDYYANFKSELPYFTYTISTFMLYSLCIYLATKPKKLQSTIVLLMVIVANTIHLFIGTRNPFILSLIFAFLYYFMRNQSEKGKWIGFKEKIILYVGTPLIMILMGLLNYIRDDAEVKDGGIGNLILDFIYKQGTSFGVLARGYLYNSNIPVRDTVNFTFGPILEYYTKGSLGILFGGKPFVNSTNSIELALESNSYSHNISYIVLDKEYLDGHGIGSSYIMELYTDYGFFGVFLFNILLGILFIYMMRIAYRMGVLAYAITLLILNYLFFMPRSSFSESFLSLFTMQFWGIVLLIFLGAGLLNKNIKHIVNRKGEQ